MTNEEEARARITQLLSEIDGLKRDLREEKARSASARDSRDIEEAKVSAFECVIDKLVAALKEH